MASGDSNDKQRLKATALIGLAVEQNARHQPADISDEQLAAYIDNGLPEEESALVRAALTVDSDLFERWQDLAEELDTAAAPLKAPATGHGARSSAQTPPSIMQRAIEWLQANLLLGGGAGAALAGLLFVVFVVDPSQRVADADLNIAQLSSQLDQRYAQLNSTGITSQQLSALPNWSAAADSELVAMGASLDDVVYNAFNAGVKTGLELLNISGELKSRYAPIDTAENCYGLKRAEDCTDLFTVASYTGRWAVSMHALCSSDNAGSLNPVVWKIDKKILISLSNSLTQQAPQAKLTELMQRQLKGMTNTAAASCELSRQLFDLVAVN